MNNGIDNDGGGGNDDSCDDDEYERCRDCD
jgi:hypothetical protein